MGNNQIRVLVVEDHEITQRVIKMILMDSGCSVNITSTATEALELFQKNEYELILIDIGLPDVNGLDIAEQMKNSKDEKAKMPIVILSAYSDDLYREKAKFIGLEEYIVKPFTKEICARLLTKLFPKFKKSLELKNFPILEVDKKEPNKIQDMNYGFPFINTLKTIKINGFEICYNNEQAAKEIYAEVFLKKIYDFKTNKKNPVIIDAGSNIGIATLYFKMKYPLSKIICFEPDPNTFEVLQKNVAMNSLKNVSLVNVALSKKEGVIPFFGEIYGMEANSIGNTIVREWGNQRETCSEIFVNSTRLSSYISEEIDFLKMDIEGAEQEVLEELGEKLKFVNKVTIEVHETEMVNINNDLQRICEILKQYGFRINIEPQDSMQCFPKQVAEWVKRVRPRLSLVKGEKI